MTASIIKFPYSVSRRAHSRKPRRSKNGTPEKRARRAAAAPAQGPTFSYFLQQLRAYLFQETERGKTWYRALDDLQAICEEKAGPLSPN